MDADTSVFFMFLGALFLKTQGATSMQRHEFWKLQ